MSQLSVIGIDLAKNSFQLHGVDAKGKDVLRKKLWRDQVTRFFANLPQCLVGMEACATSGYWARVIESCGHTVRRIHPRFVKPYLMADKFKLSTVSGKGLSRQGRLALIKFVVCLRKMVWSSAREPAMSAIFSP